MTRFDSFASQLLEESKALLDKAKAAEDFSQATYLHSSLLLAISALEACINSISDELLIEPFQNGYTVHEQGLLLEREVRFEKGDFILSNSLKISRITDRIEFLYSKFAAKKLDVTFELYTSLKQSIDLRNKLVHPKEDMQVTVKQVELAIFSVIDAINELYKAVYQRKFPSYNRGISPKLTLS